MGEPETATEVNQDKVARAVHHLMRATIDLSDLVEDPEVKPLVRLEYLDINEVQKHIHRLLVELR